MPSDCVFWSSVVLTGNRSNARNSAGSTSFWSSVVLTGNRSILRSVTTPPLFWSSVVLTGNRSALIQWQRHPGFGVASF